MPPSPDPQATTGTATATTGGGPDGDGRDADVLDGRGPGRRVTVVLCTPQGRPLGTLPAVDVPVPYWQEVGDVVDAVHRRFGVRVTVLRLLHAERAGPPDGGPVGYLAQTADPLPPAATPSAAGDGTAAALADHPRRAPYARPGGPDGDLAWALDRLAACGLATAGPPRQVRTWNLSSVWQLPTSQGRVWLKVVPPFLAREAAVVAAVGPGLGPPVLAAEGTRVLLGDVPGDDQYGADGPRVLALAEVLARLQSAWRGRGARILALGGVDRRPHALVPAIRAVLARYRDTLAGWPDAVARDRLSALVDGLADRFAALAGCGLPDVLVHGDLHPGNVRGRPGAFAVLDWGEAGVGSPAIDVLTLTSGLGPADREAVESLLAERWRRLAPGSDLRRAVALLRPVAPLLSAVTYQGFLDAVEPDERRYHAGDPPACLAVAAGTGARLPS